MVIVNKLVILMGQNFLLQVKRSIMLKMADACQHGSTKPQTFHEMHVQRYNNVSILYADIVNFTPLSERLSASDLVKTLNELFGRFDQIAQVLRCILITLAERSLKSDETFEGVFNILKIIVEGKL